MRVLVRLLKVILPVAVLGLAAVAAVAMIASRPNVVTQPPPIAPPGVRVHQVNLESVHVSVTSQGTVRPRTETQIVPEVAGRVIWVAPSFASGGFFEQGDVLLRIDPFDYEQAVISARSQLSQARLRLAQEEAEAEVAQREWDALGFGDPRALTLREPQLEEARASVAAAEANFVRSERDLERANVTAPYAGRVRTKTVDVGQFVTVGSAIATIYGVDVAEVRLPLPDEELAYLDLPLTYRGSAPRVGPRVRLRTTFAGSDYEWDGRIVRTESEIDPVSRMVHLVAEVNNPYASGPDLDRPPLAVGMYVEAEIEGRTFDDIAVIPRAALRGRSQVLLIDTESRVRFREVDVLRTTTTSAYVTGGLSTGELVAISAIDHPTEGMLVQVTDLGADLQASQPSHGERLTRVSPKSETQARDDSDRLESAGAQAARLPRSKPPVNELTAPAQPGNRSSNPQTAATFDAILAESRGRTIAVRTFSTVTDSPKDTALAEAIVRVVTEQLSNLPSVWVVPVERDASWAISGGIQRIGDVVRVTARLIDVGQNAIVWAITVDRPLDQIGRLQEDVAADLRKSVRAVTS